MIAPPETPCFANIVQGFLVCTTVHKAKHLGVLQGDILVRVNLEKSRRQTKVFSNSENPYFNEYFVFELKTTLTDLLRMSIMYEVKKRTTCKKNSTLGELLVDLQSVWQQPNRCYFKKWGKLEIPIGNRRQKKRHGVERGYLQIDLAIITQAVSTNLLRSMDASTYRLLLNHNVANQTHIQLVPPENTENSHQEMVVNRTQVYRDYDDIQRNLLSHLDSSVRCNIRYNITFYHGFMLKRNDYYIQFRFHPFKGKTKVAKSTQVPIWNQDITFTWTYPSLAQTFLVQLLIREHLHWKCISEYELHFDEIAFYDTPALGPTYIHFYDNGSGWHYVGRVLMQIKSECIKHVSNRELKILSVPKLAESDFWSTRTFQLEFIAFQGDFVHYNGSNCKLSIRLAEKQSNFLECYLKNYTKKNMSKYFTNSSPFKGIYLHITLPDNRSKYESDYCLIEIYEFVKNELEVFQLYCIQYAFRYQSQVKVLRSVIHTIIHRLSVIIETQRLRFVGNKKPTIWDQNRLDYLQAYFTNLIDTYRGLRNRLRPQKGTYIDIVIKEVVQEITQRSYELHKLMAIARVQDEWPDLMLILSANGREIGYCRLNARNFLFPPKDRRISTSNQCWKKNNFIFKDNLCQHSCSNCGCVVGIVQGCLSIVAEDDRNSFVSYVSNEWIIQEPHYWKPIIPETHFKCRVFLHQAKIRPGNDRTGLCDPFVRIMICNQSADTPIVFETLSPIWNTVISFDRIVLPGGFDSHLNSPPLLIVELFDTDIKTAEDYLGCGHCSLTVITSDWADSNLARPSEDGGDYLNFKAHLCHNTNSIERFQCLKLLSPPPLKWLPIIINGGVRAEVLLSAEIVEIDPNDSDITEQSMDGLNMTIGIPAPIRPNMRNFILQVIFVGLRNYQKFYGVGVGVGNHHRIKIMMGDLQLVSGISAPRIKQSINFLSIEAVGVVSLPDQLDYWPAIVATDVSISNRGTESTLGAVLISDCKQYLRPYKEYKCQAICSSESKPGQESDDVSVRCFIESRAPSRATSARSSTMHLEDDNNVNTNETYPLLEGDSKSLRPISTWDKIVSRYFFSNAHLSNNNDEVNINSRIENANKIKFKKRTNFIERTSLDRLEDQYTWWTKFYNSNRFYNEPILGIKHHLCIYENELEKQSDFSYLIDWAEPLKLVHGVKYKKHALIKEETYATLKLHIRIMPCQYQTSLQSNKNVNADEGRLKPMLANMVSPRYQKQLQSLSEMVKILVRIYLVQGLNLRPHEKNFEANAYIKMKFGSRHVSNKAQIISNGNNPIYGECFELEGILPREHILEISAINRTSLRDDLVGTTLIDVEDRWRTQHRATVGISNEYSNSGYNRWRNTALPTDILKELCQKHDIDQPHYSDNFIDIDGVRLTDTTKLSKNEDIKQRLALTALKNLDQLPSFGYKLVPEHVETRSLYRDDVPGIEQGKLQLWIELYDSNLNIPPAIDIMPDPPVLYELRVIIHQCCDVILDERNIFGTAMSDIYVKGWFTTPEEPQFTDTHYRSLNGAGKFNWRMIFPIKYSPIEDMAVVLRKSGFNESYEVKMPPKLYLQLYDNDLISEDDFLGCLEINLAHFCTPVPNPKQCILEKPEGFQRHFKSMFTLSKGATVPNKDQQYMNLFRDRKVRGWFPMKGHKRSDTKKHSKDYYDNNFLAGKIELELEVLLAEDAEQKPVGIGRHPPQALPEPSRPQTSFNPWFHPIQAFNRILLPPVAKCLVITLILLIVGVMILLFIMKVPILIMGH